MWPSLLAGCGSLQKQHFELTNKDGVRRAFDGYAGVAATEVVMRFLKSYRWQESKRATSPIDLELKYIAKQNEFGRLKEWLVLIPQAKTATTKRVPDPNGLELSVILRDRVSETRFGVYSEPRHREILAYPRRRVKWNLSVLIS